MNKEELIDLLEDLAKKDLEDGADIFDHPCSVAVRAINKYESDISELQNLAKGSERSKSKRIQTLVRGIYCPSW